MLKTMKNEKYRCSEAFEEISRIFPRKMPQWKKLSKILRKFQIFSFQRSFCHRGLEFWKHSKRESFVLQEAVLKKLPHFFWKLHNFESTILDWQKFQNFRFSRFSCNFCLIFYLVLWLGCRQGFCEEQTIFPLEQIPNCRKSVEQISNLKNSKMF